MIVAKTVIPNQYWILRENDEKVGNIEADSGGFRVKIKNQVERYKTIHTIKKRRSIDFDRPIPCRVSKSSDRIIYGYTTSSQPHNAIYDVRLQVPLWTKESRSKSWYAAGWYRIKQGRRWQVCHCPKLITLQRYQYLGPFQTQQEAEQA